MKSLPSSISIFRLVISVGLGIAASLVATGLMIEIALRLVGYENVVLYRFDPVLGKMGRPNLEGVQSVEGRSPVHLNSLGMHDTEHVIKKPAGTLRVVILGASMSAANQVPLQDTYAHQLPRFLERCPAVMGRRIEVINLAFDGFNLTQQYIVMRDMALAFKPDLIMVTENPLAAVISDYPGKAQADHSPFFFRHGRALYIDTSFNKTAFFHVRASPVWRSLVFLSDYSRVLQYLIELRGRLSVSEAENNEFAAPNDMRTAQWTSGFESVRLALRAMAALGRRSHVPMVLAVATSPGQVDPIAPRDRSDYDFLESRFRLFALESGWPFVSISHEMQAYARAHRYYLHGFGGEQGKGHWNRRGNAEAAVFYARALCPLIQSGMSSNRLIGQKL